MDNKPDVDAELRDSVREITQRIQQAARLNVRTELPYVLADITRYLSSDDRDEVDGWNLVLKSERALYAAFDDILRAAGFYDAVNDFYTGG